MAAARAAKIERYEVLLNERLKGELQQVHDERDAVHERLAQVLELRNNVRVLREQKQTSLKTMVNLGSDFYVQAKVPDTTYLYVGVGLGFHAQLTLDEAEEFCSQREAHYSVVADGLTERAAHLKARIKLVVAAIDELGAT
jgi:prefoldin alpha subunit